MRHESHKWHESHESHEISRTTQMTSKTPPEAHNCGNKIFQFPAKCYQMSSILTFRDAPA